MTNKAREALAELVALEDLRKSLARANDRFARFRTDKNYAVVAKLQTDLWRRDPLAWSAARAALAEPSQPERSTKYSDEPWQDALLERAKAAGFRYDGQSLWEASLYTNELLALLSPSQPAGPTLTDERIDHIADIVVKGMPEGIHGFCKSWGWRQFARAILHDCRAAQPAGRVPLPEVLFDGYAVSQALSPQAKQRTSLENVSDVLDAVVRLLRHPAGLSAADAREHSSGTAGAGERE
jgi:hypothetical protein